MGVSFITEDKVIRVKSNPWADNFFRPLLITIMIMCLNLSLVNLVRVFNPAWSGAYFLLGMLLTTIEAIYSYRVLRHYRLRGISSTLRYRLAEGALLILALKLLSFAGKPAAAIWTELQLIWQQPDLFVSMEFYVLLVLACIAWLAATNTMADFEALHDPYAFRSENITPLDNLAVRFFWGGGILVLISGLTMWLSQAKLSGIIDFEQPAPKSGGIIINVLIYFTLGLVVLSQAHLTRLLMRWRTQDITVAPNLVKQWAKYGLLFLGLITFLVFFLPTGYTFGFLTSAGLIIQFLIEILVFIIRLILIILTLPLAWLLSLLGIAPQRSGFRSAGPVPLPELPPDGGPVSWLEVVRSLIFWLLAGAIIWYLLKSYLNDHPELLEGLRRFKLANLLISLLGQLWRRLSGWVQVGLDLIPKRIIPANPDGEPGSISKRWRWAGVAGLSARERILYYYLNTLQRVTRQGPLRKPSQTPYEYEPDLSQTIPEAQPAINLLTQAFVRARYSQESFTETQAALAKTMWQQIRQALRRHQEANDAERKE